MGRTTPRAPSARSLALAALAVGAAVCTGSLAALRGDDGRLPSKMAVMSLAPAGSAGEAADAAAGPSDELSWPLRGKVTSRFGEHRGGHRHAGLDIPMPAGTPIKAAGDGTVVLRKLEDGYGKYTCVAHDKLTTCYGHQSRFRTTLGASVRRGQVIGYVGNTGNSATVHLHFEVRRGRRPWGRALDPAKLLPRG